MRALLRAALLPWCLAVSGSSLASAANAPPARTLRVCVYYDDVFPDGRIHAIMLENLLGHFRETTPALAPAKSYRSGDLGRCDRAAYIGEVSGAPLPPDFLADVGLDRKPFLWINENVVRLRDSMGLERFVSKTGFLPEGAAGFETTGPAEGAPEFFRYFDYKGERFVKMAYRTDDGVLIAAPAIHLLRDVSAVVVSTATRPGDGRSTPYITTRDGFFYVADNPFLFIHEQDRYLILADVLFDFLKLPPRDERRRALIRIEDIHPSYDLRLLYQAVDVLNRRRVPFAISLIPEYVPAGRPESAAVAIDQRPEFVRAIRYALRHGGEVLIHGLTHDVAPEKDCPSLGSGYDYEFWDRCRGAPLAYDSKSFAAARVARAKSLLAAVGLSPVGWVTPHYSASPGDFMVFGRQFKRTVQRVTYSLNRPTDGSLIFVNQFFPYTIYKDHYGQFVWPENLGFVPIPGSHWGYATPPDILESARLTRAVRDGWASFFWHPQLLKTPEGKKQLERLIDGVRASGYEFVSLKALEASGE